jgi:hypothetical protein
VRLARRHSVWGWLSAQARLLRQVRPVSARRGGRWVPLAAPSVRLRLVAWRELRRGAAARPCFRRAEVQWSAQPSAAVQSVWWALRLGVAAQRCFRRAEAGSSELVWRQAPAAAWRQPVEAAAVQARASPSGMKAAAVGVAQPVASAQWARPLAEVAEALSGAKVRPRAAAEALPVPWVRPLGVGEAESAVPVQPREAAESAVAAQRLAVEAAAQPAAVRLLGAEVVARLDAAEPQPAAEQRAPSVRQRAAAHPFAAAGRPWPGRRPWLAPRQAERSAHAMRKSRAASPSRRLWQAAGCEDLS